LDDDHEFRLLTRVWEILLFGCLPLAIAPVLAGLTIGGLIDQHLGREGLGQDGQQLFDIERLEHHADAEPVQLRGHVRIIDRPRGGGAEDQRDTGKLRIKLREREELPALLLGLLKEQVLDDDIAVVTR
jgi:hypothetical protein